MSDKTKIKISKIKQAQLYSKNVKLSGYKTTRKVEIELINEKDNFQT